MQPNRSLNLLNHVKIMPMFSCTILLITSISPTLSESVRAEDDTYVITEGDTVLITNQPSRTQRRRGRKVNPRRGALKSCYLENKKTGEQSLISAPTRAQLRRSRIIWCDRAEPPQSRHTRKSSSPRLTSRKTRAKRRAGKRSLPKRAEAFREFVSGAARQHNLPEALLWAFMKVESDFIPTAVSRKGAQGLMQLMPLTAQDMGVADPFDPKQNIYGAAKLINILMRRFKRELPLVISAYHAGGGAVSRREGIPYTETSQYMTSVLNAYYRYMKAPPYLRSKAAEPKRELKSVDPSVSSNSD